MGRKALPERKVEGMRWANHKMTVFGTVYAVTGNLTASIAATVCSIFPDAVEFPFKGLVEHRGLSHWPWLYLVPGLGLGSYYMVKGDLIAFYLLFCFLGPVLHLAADMGSPGGIPLGRPGGRKTGFDLYVPFSKKETAIAMLITAAGLAIGWWRDFYDLNYLAGEVERLKLVLEYFGRRIAS